MALSSRIGNANMVKRLRNDDKNDIDSLERQLPSAQFEYGFKRLCSNNRGSVILSLNYEQDQGVVVFNSNGDTLREKTADSESSSSMVYIDTQFFLHPFLRINISDSILGSHGPDDAQSSTSDSSSSCCCCHTCDDEGGGNAEYNSDTSSSTDISAPNQSVFNYLSQASDDDLGLPPAVSNLMKEKYVDTLDLDLDVADDDWLGWDL